MSAKIEQIISDVKTRWENRSYDIPIWRVMVLAEMAHNNISPDGTFSDAECIIWELFKRES